MHTEIKKWGNSAVIRLPASMLAQMRLSVGSQVEIETDGSRLIIEPSVKRRYRLGDLVAGITEENRHDETDWGKPVGLEFPD
jgi:antitoxin MazE